MKLTEAQYKTFLSKSIDYKQSKYKNKKVIYDGIEFHSQKEGNYYLKLKTMEKLGLIKDLELQKEYILQDKFVLNGKTRRKITYNADFSYITTEDDKLHVVDVKGFKTDVYKLKKKLFEYKYQTELEEV
jgi:hypothetical protein